MTLRFTDGPVTVQLDGALERWVADLLTSTQSETVRVMRAAADEVAAAARAAWYGPMGVRRETGLSGDIRVVTTIDAGRGELRVSVGSTDPRMAGGRPVPTYVHRPTRLSTILVETTPREYFAAPESMRGPWKPGPTGKRIPQLFSPNPRASDGKKLLQVLVRAPLKARVGKLGPTVGAAIGRRVRA